MILKEIIVYGMFPLGSQLSWERYRADAIPYQQRPPYDHTTRSQHVC